MNPTYRGLFGALSLVVLAFAAACGGETSDPTATRTPSGDASPIAASPAPGTRPPLSATDFVRFYAENCAVCHGADRDGVGRTPALTADALTDDIEDYLDETDDRTHRSIWERTALTQDDRVALLEYLASSSP